MWHRQAKHCPICGAALVEATIEARARQRCSACAFVLYLNPACAAAGVVVNPRGEVLLVKRAIDPWKGYWALPAGYQEIDEGPELAIAREVAEEAGIEARVLGLLDLFFIESDPRKPANVAVYLCGAEAVEPRPLSDDVSDAAWFALHALPEKIGFDNYRRILSRLADRSGYPPSTWSHLDELLGRDR